MIISRREVSGRSAPLEGVSARGFATAKGDARMSSFGWMLRTGLVAAGATLVAGLTSFGPIAVDVAQRTQERLAAEGRSWAKVAIDGRDVTLSGTAPDPSERVLAAESADRVFGVRVVADATTVLPLASPWAWGIERTEIATELFGAVSSEEARRDMRAAAATALGSPPPKDSTTPARGAPSDWTARRDLALALAADLKTGKVEWVGDELRVSGTPRDFAAWQAMNRRLAAATNGKIVADLVTPAPPRWSFSATRAGDRLVLDGFLPSVEDRDRIVAAAKEAAATVEDRTTVAPGAAEGTDAALDFAVRALAGMTDGGVKIDPAGFTIAGRAKTRAIWSELKARLKAGVPGGLPLVADGLVPVEPDSYALSLKTGDGGVTAEGFAPDAESRDRIASALAENFGRVAANIELAPGAPAGFVDTVVALLPSLARFASVDARLADGAVKVSGTAPTEALGRQILAKLGGLLPKGWSLAPESSVAAQPLPAQVGAAECEADLARVQSSGKILFDTGQASLREEGVRILDALVATCLKCMDARVTVEGHTDDQGDEAANRLLSETRARAVVDHLVAGGIAPDRLKAVGWGQTRPIGDNATEEGRRQNRRIEFRVE